MAEREINLRLTPREELALSRLIGHLCQEENTRNTLSNILGYGSPDVEAIGRVNGALNCAR